MKIFLAGHSVDHPTDVKIAKRAQRLISYFHIQDGLGTKFWKWVTERKGGKDATQEK